MFSTRPVKLTLILQHKRVFCQQRCADVRLGSRLFTQSTCQVPPVAGQPQPNTPSWRREDFVMQSVHRCWAARCTCSSANRCRCCSDLQPLVKDKIRSAAFSRRTKQVFQVLFNSLLRHLLRGCALKDTDLVLHLWCHRGNGCPFGPSVYFALLFLSPSKHAEGPAKLCKQRAKLHEFLCKVFLHEVRMKEDLKIPDTGSSTLKQTHLLTAHHWEKQKNKQKKTRV